MKDVPKWVTKIVESEHLKCNKCRKIFKSDRLISIGVQESTVEPHADTLCVGMYCPSCREMTIFELKEMSLVEFAFEILEKETEPKNKPTKRTKSVSDVLKEVGGTDTRKSPSKKRKRSKITKKEMSDDIKFLRAVETHEEFLVAMGLPPEEISKYNRKKNTEE